MSEDRVPSGIKGLDPLVEDGFPRGSLVLVAGNPGTGKTVLGAEFLYHGAVDCGEKGVYVSFAEGRNLFIENMLRFGLDFEELEEKKKIKVLDLVTVKERGIEAVMEMIIGEVSSLKANRLVIDSFSAMAHAFQKAIDARILIHILGKMVRRTGCTSLLVTEIPTGSEQIGLGTEEFVADGILILRRGRIKGRLAREMEVAKLRGTRLRETIFLFSLEQGFRVFPPFALKPVRKPRRFKPVSDSATHFSTGNQDLDKMLGGGYPRGGVVLIEVGEGVSRSEYNLVLVPTFINFLSQGKAVVMVPSSGIDADHVLGLCRAHGLSEEETLTLLRVAERRTPSRDQNKPYIMIFEAETPEEDYSRWKKTQHELRRETKHPVLEVVGVDTLEAMFGEASSKSIVLRLATDTRREGDLTIILSKPGMEPITQRAANVSEVHLKLVREHGTPLLFGLKPRTGLHAVDMDVSKGYPLPRITPIV